MHAVRIHEYGPPEVLRYEELPEPEVGPGQALIESAAIGVVFSETQVRAGKLARFGLAQAEPPYVFGRDVAGTIVAVGDGVDDSLVGTRVLASTDGTGAYAERVAVAASGTPSASGALWSCLTPIPDGLGFDQGAALLGQGRTALGLVREVGIQRGTSVLVTAAAGGIGTLLLRLARAAGATTVIGAAGAEHKLAVATRLGADVVVDYSEPDWGDRVRAATDGRGVDVVFDAVGGDVARTAFDVAADGRGTVVLYGMSSGQLAEMSSAELLRRGLTISGFSGARFDWRPSYVAELQSEILDLAVAGDVEPIVGRTFPLAGAADAHAAVEARDTIGMTLLVPENGTR